MRDYSTVRPRFWTHGTGRELRGDPIAQLMAMYLMTAPSHNLIGLYYLPFPTLVHETGLKSEGAFEALARLSQVDFASYDEPSEYVWVHNMAAQQLGARLELADNRRAGVVKELERHRASPFYGAFYERYRGPFSLDAPLKGDAPRSPSGGGNKGLSRVRSGSGSGSGSGTRERESARGAHEKRPLSLAKSPPGDPEPEQTAAPRPGSAVTGAVVPPRAGGEFGADAMRELFRATFLQLREVEPKLEGSGTSELHLRVVKTAAARGVDARALFAATLHRWLTGELNDLELAAPYACFASAWGGLVDRVNGRAVDPKAALMRKSAAALKQGDQAAYEAAEQQLAQLMGGGHAAAGE